MKHIGFVLVLLFSLTLFGNVLAGDKEDVQKAFNDAIRAFNSKDYETYFSYLADNFEAFTGVVTPLLHEGKPHWMSFINGLGELPSVTYNQQQNSMRVFNGDTAVINGYFIFTVVGKDGITTTQSGRNSTTLVKQGGKWTIVNFHFSSLFES